MDRVGEEENDFTSGRSLPGNLADQSGGGPRRGWSERERQLSCVVTSGKFAASVTTRKGLAGPESSDSLEVASALLMTNRK